MRSHSAVLVLFTTGVVIALDNGVGLLPPMGFNTYNSGLASTDANLNAIGEFFVSSGLKDKGYIFVNTDDGWSLKARSNSTGCVPPDPAKYPQGIPGIVSKLHALGLKFGIYTSESSVMCGGEPGALYNEVTDARCFTEWGVDYVKVDLCGEYGLGSVPKFQAWADAVNRTGRPMLISTEPFSIVPTASHADFANVWRCCNDINKNWATILSRADLNDKWAALTGPGRWSDPDLIQVGNSGLSDAECRSHFGMWALMKSPLILSTDLLKLSPALLAVVGNTGVIGVNQDALAVQARKLSADGIVSPMYAGVAPCDAGAKPGINGVSSSSLGWTVIPHATSIDAGYASSAPVKATLFNNETGRCLGLGTYHGVRNVPLLLPCNASDPLQAWTFPNGTYVVGAILSSIFDPTGLPMALTVANSTVYGSIHGKDTVPLLDSAYGINNLTLTPYTPRAICKDRKCDDYVPTQTWYWSPITRKLALALFTANAYRCYEGTCYELTAHIPAATELCLAHVLSISNDGTQNDIDGIHIWGGPLSGGRFVLGLQNRNVTATANVRWALLEASGVGDATSMCVRELYSNAALGVFVGGVSLSVPEHDMLVLQLTPGVTTC